MQSYKSYIIVAIQAVLILAVIGIGRGTENSSPLFSWTGLTMQFIGTVILLIAVIDLRKSLSVFPKPVKHGELQIQGLYRYVRHPMYTGVLLLCAGIAMQRAHMMPYLATIALFGLFSYKARYEESLLKAKYKNYSEYAKKTPRFFPGFKR